jgi:glycosyltransferase involved in cell wall biosynthesis
MINRFKENVNNFNCKYKISILIPCYNVEKYINRCLDSLINSTFDKNMYCIICYDDGSNDKTLKILRKYVTKYDNIIILDNRINQGTSHARQQLLNHVKTEYFYFVDADDFVEKDGLFKMYKVAQETNAELTFAKSYIYKSNKKIKMN